MTAAVRFDPPSRFLTLSADEADEVLDRLEENVPVHSSIIDLPGPPFERAIVFGDTHGDWRSSAAAAERFLTHPGDRILVGLGDYIDRAPDDCAEGSVANALYLLSLASVYPDRVFLLQGNHETHRTVPVVPHDLPEEVDLLWGPQLERYARIMGLLERGPFIALAPSRVFFAHGGFPRSRKRSDWRESFDPREIAQLLDVVWGDCAASRSHRGVVPPFDERDLDRFLEVSGNRGFLRGHDADLTGRSVFHHRCLTIHTSRIYERYGGVVIARVPLVQPVNSTEEIELEHLETEGREYPPP